MGASATRRRIFLILLPLLLLALGAIIYFRYFWFSFGDPHVARLVPILLRDTNISAATGSTLSYLGYKFEVPWDDADTSDAKESGNVAIIPFSSGLTIAFLTHSSHELVDEIAKSGGVKREQLCEMYGNSVCESDYAFKKLMLEASPAKLSLFMPRVRSARLSYLLLLKSAAIRETSGLFLIDTTEYHGFQFGDVTTARGEIVDELYGRDIGLEIIFGRRDGKPLGISQPEINRVIQTVHTR